MISCGVPGVSRRELADALSVHYQTVGCLERGEYSPSLYLALRIAEYFEVPARWCSPPLRSPGLARPRRPPRPPPLAGCDHFRRMVTNRDETDG